MPFWSKLYLLSLLSDRKPVIDADSLWSSNLLYSSWCSSSARSFLHFFTHALLLWIVQSRNLKDCIHKKEFRPKSHAFFSGRFYLKSKNLCLKTFVLIRKCLMLILSILATQSVLFNLILLNSILPIYNCTTWCRPEEDRFLFHCFLSLCYLMEIFLDTVTSDLLIRNLNTHTSVKPLCLVLKHDMNCTAMSS